MTGTQQPQQQAQDDPTAIYEGAVRRALALPREDHEASARLEQINAVGLRELGAALGRFKASGASLDDVLRVARAAWSVFPDRVPS